MTRLVYVLAASHSGSTLTAMLLGAHPEICTVGELKWTSMGSIDKYRCSCGAWIKECPFWCDISASMARKGQSFQFDDARTDVRSEATPFERRLLAPLHRSPALEALRDAALNLSPGWRQRLARHQARNAALIESVLERAGKKVLVDSSKVGIRLKYLLRTPGLDVRVVRVVRDGRAVSLTYTDPATFADAVDSTLKGGGSGASRDAQRISMTAAATRWLRSNEEADAILKGLPSSRWAEVRYEDLCARPEETLRKLFAFIGVDESQVRLDFRKTDHHVVGNGMRLDQTSEIRLDERWRTALGNTELATFDQVAGALNRRFGYV